MDKHGSVKMVAIQKTNFHFCSDFGGPDHLIRCDLLPLATAKTLQHRQYAGVAWVITVEDIQSDQHLHLDRQLCFFGFHEYRAYK